MTEPNRAIEAEPVSEQYPITISIYQNADYVEGILQQTHQRPLLTEVSQSSEDAESDSGHMSKSSDTKVGGFAKFGLFGADSSMESRSGADQSIASSQNRTYTSSSKYTQSFYLHAAIRALHELGAVTTVEGKAQASGLLPGQFVQFTAEFRPSQLISLLDIATPDLVERLVHHFTFKQELDSDKASKKPDVKAVEAAIARAEASSSSRSSIARSAMEALRIDFRSPKTREYYGQIGSGDDSVTAVTICDIAHFVIEDEDRILDGEFTVLGKVISRIEVDEPILARNKILDRLNPKAVDELVDTLNSQVAKQANEAARHVDAPLDLKLDARISGTNFKVIPIAVFL